MKLKLDADNHAVLDNGNPVYVKDDGTDQVYDVASLVKKITDLNHENAGSRIKNKELLVKIESFADLDIPLARKAIQTVKDFDDKKLIDAGEADRVKQEMVKGYKKQIDDLSAQNAILIDSSNQQTLSLHFAKSDLISKTNLSPDIATTVFSKHFAVEGGLVKTKDNIMSQQNPGDPAGFEEALGIIIAARPDASSIMKTNGSGSGSQSNAGGNLGNNPFKDGTVTEQAALIKKDRVTAVAMAKAAGKEIPGLTK